MTKLSESFLAPYRRAGDVFPNLLSRVIFLTKYCRRGESWTDCIQRVVEGNCALDKHVKREEAEGLFDVFWSMQGLPAGRGLWTGGVEGIPIDSRYNCHSLELRDVDDWVYTMSMLMAGGGVGVSLARIDTLPEVTFRPGFWDTGTLTVACRSDHPNAAEVQPHKGCELPPVRWLEVGDSREGWAEALGFVLRCAFTGFDCGVDVSKVRARGSALKTFGGVACGPGPLALMLRRVHGIVRGAAGRRLNSVECLDITNWIGHCVKSGNVRRSALIVMGDGHDREFRRAKQDMEAVVQFRHTSNNSILLQSREQIERLDWRELAEEMACHGEPGIVNLALIREAAGQEDCIGVNPCAEIPLEHRGACCLSEVFPARIPKGEPAARVFHYVARYTLRQRLQPMTDPIADDVRQRTMRIGVGLGGICDIPGLDRETLLGWKHAVHRAAWDYADELGVARPVAMTTCKPSGTVSLLNGSSPGMHAPFSPYYVRRVQLGRDEPMSAALQEAGVPWEESVYDQTGKTLVFEFPMTSVGSACTQQSESTADQFARQKLLQECYTDNAVSATITFRSEAPNALEELADHLQTYVPYLKSTSCLPAGTGQYAQMPYETMTRDDYMKRRCEIDDSAGLTHDYGRDSLDVGECSGGSCPTR